MTTAITINDYIKEHDKNKKDIADTSKRVSDIVANNGNGTKDSEIVDARRGKASLRDRIDEVENKIAINNDEMTKEVVDARTDFDGGIHKNLNLRLLEDFNNLYKLIYNSTLLEYEGQYITANNSYKGVTEDMQIKGRTLQNVIKNTTWNVMSNGTVAYMNVDWSLLKPNTKYTYIVYNPNSKVNLKNGFVGVKFTTPSGRDISKPTLVTTVSDLNTTGILQPHVYPITGETLTTNDLTNMKLMLLEGDWTSKEVPTYFEGIRSVGESDENLELVSCSKNLFDKRVEKISTVYNYNASYKMEGDELIVTSVKGDLATSYIAYPMRLKPNTDYRVYTKSSRSGTTGGGVTIYSIDNKVWNTGSSNAPSNDAIISFPFKTDNTGRFNFLLYAKTNSSTIESARFKDIQITENTDMKPYEPYTEHRQAITLTEPLRGLSNGICDIVDFKNGKVIKNIGKTVFNGSENWLVIDNTLTNTIMFYLTMPLMKIKTLLNITCDKFPNDSIYTFDKEGIQGTNINSNVVIRIERNKLKTVDAAGFKTWLQANPVTVYYQLETPVETLIDLIPPRTYDGVTYLFTEGSLIEPILSCKVPSNIPAKIQTLSMENRTLQAENIKFKNTLEESNLTSIENSVNQESKITMMELGVM